MLRMKAILAKTLKIGHMLEFYKVQLHILIFETHGVRSPMQQQQMPTQQMPMQQPRGQMDPATELQLLVAQLTSRIAALESSARLHDIQPAITTAMRISNKHGRLTLHLH